MGDISVEPSMEDILSSIKRIIAEDGDASAARQRRSPRAPAPPVPHELGADEDADEVGAAEILELNDPMPQPASPPPVDPTPAPSLARRGEPAAAAPSAIPADPMLSSQAMAATRGSLDLLSRLLVKPEPGGDGTLEGLVREMLRPMLREWLDANLPGMVEAMVAREIARITGQQG